MTDLALESSGASILMATSHDDEHPPERILDPNEATFWSSTGMFPQEFIIAFSTTVQISKLKFVCANVRQIVVMRCDAGQPMSFDQVFKEDFTFKPGKLQSESRKPSPSPMMTRYLKVIINSGWDDFVTIHKVYVEGSLPA
eukprot:TRINITY_DN1275_c0_g1_i2.p1 TRINITY_DN1275_c0_g1~~TRINITY_DN1275_c0_g1_i2.p1  ORF type:complete len:141 (+),score=26.67 TRINITY_DN1275_c0_g1_i2:269-691(+)